MVYSSDTTVLDSVITTHGLSWGFDRIFAASANHSIWFHRQVDFNDWVLYSTSSPVAADSRGLGTGHFFDRSGQPLATVVQEGVLKYFPPPAGKPLRKSCRISARNRPIRAGSGVILTVPGIRCRGGAQPPGCCQRIGR